MDSTSWTPELFESTGLKPGEDYSFTPREGSDRIAEGFVKAAAISSVLLPVIQTAIGRPIQLDDNQLKMTAAIIRTQKPSPDDIARSYSAERVPAEVVVVGTTASIPTIGEVFQVDFGKEI